MTVSSSAASSGPFLGNGVATVFPFAFDVRTTSEVKVLIDGTEQTSGYFVALSSGGGSVTFASAPASGKNILVVANPSFAQQTSFKDAGQFLASTHDDALDRAAIRDIYLKAGLDRSVRAPDGEAMPALPSQASRAGNFLAFDASGNPIPASGTGAETALRTDMAAAGGSGLIGFIQSAVGSVSRTLHSKIGETLSIDDFGTVSTANAQKAINALPSTGGTIVVGSDWSTISPGTLTVATNKAVTWVLSSAGALPEGMPGAVVTRGYRAQPNESSNGTGTRPGTALLRYIAKLWTPDVSTANQQDSIFYAEGHVPGADMPLDNEFAAYRFSMSSAAFRTGVGQPSIDVKGLQGVVVSDGGGAKARGHRVTAVAINGSTGIVNGGMDAAHRSGVIPVSWGGDGTAVFTSGTAGPYGPGGDAGHVAQVGPGIQTVYRAEGFMGIERPQYVFLQGRGAQAVRPEIAGFSLHGGGNGRIIQWLVSDTDTTEMGYLGKTGEIVATFFRSNPATISLADNASATFNLGRSSGFLAVEQTNSSTGWAFFHYRAVTGSESLTSIAAGTATVTGTGTPPADDGTTKVDFYIKDQTLIIRNRIGGTATFQFTAS